MTDNNQSSWIIPGGIIRSGYLLRQSTILKRWKRAWFVLYTSGRLSYFDTEHATSAEEHIHIAAERAQLQAASQLVGIDPPEHHDQSLLFALTTPHKMWYMCADNQDELMFVIYHIYPQLNFRAWTLSFQEATMVQPIRYGQYRGVDPAGMRAVYPEQVRDAKRFGVYDPSLAPQIYQQGGNTVIQLPPGTTLYLSPDGPMLIDANGRRTLIDERNARSLGLLPGAAFGSMMLWPMLLWMPLFWW